MFYICRMNIVMNILWIVLGGLLICIEYIIASLLLMVTIIGIPLSADIEAVSFGTLSVWYAGAQLPRR